MTDYNSLLGKLWWFYQLAFDAVVSLYCRDLLDKKFTRNSVSSQSCAIPCCLCCCMPQQYTFRQVMRKPAFLCVQLHSKHAANHGLCFVTYQVQSLYCLNLNLMNPLLVVASFLGCTAQFVSDLIRNPEDSFSHDTAHFFLQNNIWNIQNWLIWPPSKSPDLSPSQFGITIQYKNIGCHEPPKT